MWASVSWASTMGLAWQLLPLPTSVSPPRLTTRKPRARWMRYFQHQDLVGAASLRWLHLLPRGWGQPKALFQINWVFPASPKDCPQTILTSFQGSASHVTGLSASWRPIGGPRDLSWPTGSPEQPNSAWFWPRNSRRSPGVYRCSVRHILRVYVFTKIAAGKSCRLQACPPHTRQGADREPGPLTKGCTPPAAQSPVLLRWACGAFVHGGWVRPCAWAMGVNGTLGSKFSTRHSVKAKTEVGGG